MAQRRKGGGYAKAVATPTMEQLVTPAGEITYTLTRKRVRNLNLRVKADGTVAVSAPPRMPKREIEAFLQAKAGWIIAHRQSRQDAAEVPPIPYSRQECMTLLTQISDRVFPLFAGALGGQKPTLRLREMKTRWGVCHVQKRVITLNTRLMQKPLPAIEYVILHEYVHFIHPNHQAGFHAEMERLMPDYKARRKLLR